MVHLDQAVRLLVNYFHPSFKLLEQIRDESEGHQEHTVGQPGPCVRTGTTTG